MNSDTNSTASQIGSIPRPPNTPPPTRQKRVRLPLACNPCRQRKVRCDTELPQCQNCRRRGDVCETIDARRPTAPILHRVFPGAGGASAQLRKKQRLRGKETNESASHDSAISQRQAIVVSEATDSSASFGVVRFDDEAFTQHGVLSATPLQNLEFIDQEMTSGADEDSRPSPELVEQAKDAISPSMMVITAEGPSREKYMGGSSLHCLCAFLDVYLVRKGLPLISSKFHHGMKHADEFGLPLTQHLPALPAQNVLDKAIETFSSRILPLYPIIDQETLVFEAKRLRDLQDGVSMSNVWSGGLQSVIQADDIPLLCTIYCVATIGMDEQHLQPTGSGDPYLVAAYSLVGHLNAMPYLPSTQALFLISTALRGRGKEGQAWHMLGQAIRIAHSIGLHKWLPQPRGDVSACLDSRSNLSSHIWWSCYALEKQMELEMGRPSSIRDMDCDQVPPQTSSTAGPDQALDVHAIWVSLAMILGQISEHIFKRGSESSASLLYETGRLDQELQAWLNRLPEDLKPTIESARSSAHRKLPDHLATFLFLQFHQAQITLFRASLVMPLHSFTDAVQSYKSELPSRVRLLGSKGICVEAARSILNKVLDVADNGSSLWVFTTAQTFLAILVLIIYILKEPRKRMIRLDRELIVIASELIRDQWRRVGQNSDFINGCQILQDTVDAAIKMHTQRHQHHRGMIPSETPSRQATITSVDNLADCGLSELDSMAQLSQDDMNDPFENIPLDELWTMMDLGSWAVEHNFLGTS